MAKIEVAVLGGGPAGLAAAFELTACAELRERYGVTVYQRGWRLGGKCASGRRPPEARVEEHGLHVWFGFYENGFRLMERCYGELEEGPLRTLDDGFAPLDSLVLFEDWQGRWVPHRVTMPRNALSPAPVESDREQFWSLADRTLAYLKDRWIEILHELGDPDLKPVPPPDDELIGAYEIAHEQATEPDPPIESATALEMVAEKLGKHVADLVRSGLADRLEMRDRWRFFLGTLDLVGASIRGIAEEEWLFRPPTEANRMEFRKWLSHYGARTQTLEYSPVLRALYDLVFAYEDGDQSSPNLAAGKALQALIRISLTYRGSVFRKMRTGMGETVIAPLYDVLKARGVRFEFFHSITGLQVDPESGQIGRIDFVRQARLAEDKPDYDPIVVCDVPWSEGRARLRCWPVEPKWDELEPADADALRERGADLEREANPLGRVGESVPRGHRDEGRYFDEVVLAFPPTAVPGLAEQLGEHSPRMRAMVENTHSVATNAFQLWASVALGGEVGWEHGGAVAGGYADPLDAYCNMTHVLETEDWDGERPRDLVYLCGTLPDTGIMSQDAADEVAERTAQDYVNRHLRELWPKADMERLVRDRYWRANWTGSERYVMTRAGTVEHRLRAGESGYSNLKLAGDWTRNGICGGSVEAAVTSGMLAARAISGSPGVVRGVDGWLERD